MKKLFCLLVMLTLLMNAQIIQASIKQDTSTSLRTNTGIQWTIDLTWDQIKAKAKAENKYIFIDAFATWCAPCKMMDKEVFPNDTVGDYMNTNFIAVKVQMDKTGKDGDEIKRWYNDSPLLAKQFYINSYPTYVFLSPSAEIVHKITGYQPVQKFLNEAQEARRSGKVYLNPFAEYEQMVKDFESGIRNFNKMPYMVKMARESGNTAVASKIADEYVNHLLGLDKDALYKKENIEFYVSNFFIDSKSKLFALFYKNGKRVDAVMKLKGYSQKVIDNTIREEIVNKYLGKWAGMLMSTVRVENLEMPRWDKLQNEIQKKFDRYNAKRSVLAAKVKFYFKINYFDEYVKCFMKSINKYGIDTIDLDGYGYWASTLNEAGWTIFQTSFEKRYLKKGCQLLEIALNRYPKDYHFIDTYANLLYRLGKKELAIEWENKALEIAIVRKYPKRVTKELEEVIEKMKKGEPTWTGKII